MKVLCSYILQCSIVQPQILFINPHWMYYVNQWLQLTDLPEKELSLQMNQEKSLEQYQLKISEHV